MRARSGKLPELIARVEAQLKASPNSVQLLRSLASLRAYFNLTEVRSDDDRYAASLTSAYAGLELARRVGDRRWEFNMLASTLPPLLGTDRWDEALRTAEQGRESGYQGCTDPTSRRRRRSES